MKFGLENIRVLLSALDNPHQRFPSIHIAGTNGKGSTAAMIAAICTASGYKTGLYTSPHLISFTERIRINGKEISEEEVARYFQFLKKEIERIKATFFEAVTAIAFRYFADKNVDIAVVETGLGGRLDATNVITPIVTVITSIGLEHTDVLGSTLKSIAREKTGIMKPNVPCLLGKVDHAELKVLRKRAAQLKAELIFIPKATKTKIISHSFAELVVDIKTPISMYQNIRCSLVGDFQQNNVALALIAVEELQKRGFVQLNENSIRKGLSKVRKYSGLRGRLEVVAKHPLVIIDVAHNPDAIRALVESLRNLYVGKMVVLFGVMKDKNAQGMIAELLKLSRTAIAVAPKTDRAMEPMAIVKMFQSMRGKCLSARDVTMGAKFAFAEAGQKEPILVTGSHYVVGEFLQNLIR